MKKLLTLLLVGLICFSLCACGQQGSEDVVVAEPFVFREGIRFGDSIDVVASKEKSLDVDYENVGDNGYITAQAGDGIHDTLTFEGYDDAYLFYLFDSVSKNLSEIQVMLAYGSDAVSAGEVYAKLLMLYTERYGVPLTEEQKKNIPIETEAYEYATTRYEETKLLSHERWLLKDAEGYVIVDITSSISFGDSLYNFIGLRYVTSEEIIVAGGNPDAIFSE